MAFYLNTEDGDRVAVIMFEGRLDAHSSKALQSDFSHWLKVYSEFVFDCSQLDFIDSSGLGAMVSCLRKSLAAGGDLRLSGLTSKVRMVFELTRADRLFSIFPAAVPAIESFMTPSDGQRRTRK